jgi:hypothetical protein
LIQDNKGDDAALILDLRRRTQDQLAVLLRSLGINPSLPDAWARGFFLLAHYWHGVGHFALRAQRKNRNAATWTIEHNLALLEEIVKLKAKGFSESKAINQIASDPKFKNFLPYRSQQNRVESNRRRTIKNSSKESEKKLRIAALWRHVQSLKTSACLESALFVSGQHAENSVQNSLQVFDFISSFDGDRGLSRHMKIKSPTS